MCHKRVYLATGSVFTMGFVGFCVCGVCVFSEVIKMELAGISN